MVGYACAGLAAEDAAGSTTDPYVVMTDPSSAYHPIELSTTKELNLWNKKMACERAHEARIDDKGCLECHAGVGATKASDGKTSKIHNFHYAELKLGFKCGTCHKRVDHHNGNGMSLRKQTDPGLCQNCHPTFDKELFGTEQWRDIARSAAKIFFEKNE
jgi:nitrate/TMAO reductase-like tetraheme cytochrome c subunit